VNGFWVDNSSLALNTGNVTLSGNYQFGGPVTVSTGVIVPTTSTIVTPSFVLTNGSTLLLAASAASLDVQGTVSFGGSLVLDITGVSSSGLQVMTFASGTTGSFQSVSFIGSSPCQTPSIVYHPTSLQLVFSLPSSCPASAAAQLLYLTGPLSAAALAGLIFV